MHYILHADLMGSLTVLLSAWQDKLANVGVQLTIIQSQQHSVYSSCW